MGRKKVGIKEKIKSIADMMYFALLEGTDIACVPKGTGERESVPGHYSK